MARSGIVARVLLLFLPICLPGLLAASTPDSLKAHKDSTIVSYFYNDVEKFGQFNLHPNDTAITGFQNYNPLFQHDRFYASLGNIGQASRDLAPYPLLQPSGFDYGNHAFDPYLLRNDSVKYYRISKTFTELEYEQGAKREIFFHAKFSRNIYRSFNLGFEFRTMNAPGAYIRQQANHINFVLTAQFFTKDKRYGVIANFLINRIKDSENGGIQYDSLFEQNLEPNRQLIPVNLQSAQNRVKEMGFYMKHYFNLSRHPRGIHDTIQHHYVELGRIAYTFEYNRRILNYQDYQPESGFYQNIYLDTTQTRDSVAVVKILNELTWTNPSFRPDKKFRVLQMAAHIRQQYLEVRDPVNKKYFIQFIPAFEMSFTPFSSLNLNAFADYVFGDYNNGDWSLKAALSQRLGKLNRNAGTITFKGYYAIQQPAWFLGHFSGNNFRWDTTWHKQGLISGCFTYVFRKIADAGVSISRINHLVYLDETATPRQLNSEFGYIYAWLNSQVDFWRFTLQGQLAYQTIQGTSAVRLPAFMGNVTLYFTQKLFKGASTIQPGLNFYYNTRYYADAYMPATRSFYLQSTKEIGNYLYMDVFLNIKIQRARIFVMYSNFDSFFMGRYYYTTPSYPMQDASFRFGLTWRFHD
ncbi:MAG TPA: putative porin [Bacteroidales bacterium]|nr:putative porin [Bacteroidales bacterium]